MDQRKLIKLGNSSFAIALPKEWVDKAGLKKGDDVFITPNSNGELIIQPVFKKINGERSAEINIEGKDASELKRELTSYYISGSNLFHIRGKRNRGITETIKNTLRDLIGMEIIKNETEEIIAKDVFNIEEIDLNNFIRRIDNNLREMFGILINGFEKRKISQMQFSDLIDADKDINRAHFLISRILSMGVDNPSILTVLKTDSLSLVNNWWFSFNLEHIGDEIKSICKITKKEALEEKEYEKFIRLVIKLKDVYINSLEFFYKKKPEKEQILELTREGKKIWEEFDKLALDKKPTIAKIGMEFRGLEKSVYQNLKLVLNMTD